MTPIIAMFTYKRFAMFGIRICKRCLSDELRLKISRTRNIRNYLDDFEKSMLKNACSTVIALFSQRKEILENLESLKGLKAEPDLEEMIKEENIGYENALSEIECKLISNLVPKSDHFDALMIEITAGVGGQEAMLFTKELLDMYTKYFDYKSWNYHITGLHTSEIGGIRQVSLMVEGNSIYKYLQHESGIHRVQRVPATEKAGRVHTSTASVAIYPQPRDVDVVINDKDIQIETHRSSGAGGQHVNKTDSAVRITHLPTGIVVDCQIDRSQIRNRQTALEKLRNLIYQKQIKEQDEGIKNSIKNQIGTKARSDKVRTYNYLQDRVTDHRILKTYHHLPSFLKGGSMLDDAMTKLAEYYDTKNITEFLELIEKSS